MDVQNSLCNFNPVKYIQYRHGCVRCVAERYRAGRRTHSRLHRCFGGYACRTGNLAGGDGLGAAFGALAAVCAHWIYDEGDGDYHFRFGVWQDAGNLSADQSGPHPRCYAFQPGAWQYRAKLHQVPVCRGLSRAADSCMCCNLRGLIQGIATSGDPIGAIWGTVGYTVLLCFMLFKTGSIAQRIFGAH